ncbi:MAG: response regulator [Gammaproteobacteria bacterium]|nr:response regulator [Gammaproteobacteria bacterium]
MIAPPNPKDENQRLSALRSLAILDTPAEERFDRITRIAQRLFDVPIVLVSLVDAERQWFKSRVGLDVSEAARDISFCGHAILQSGPFVVPDATQDIRFRDNPLVTDEPLIRFYAAQSLTDLAGNRLGTLCLIDRRPRQLDDTQLQLLRDLASMAETELNCASYTHLTEKLLDSGEHYLAIFDNVVDGIITIDDHGLITSTNPAVERIFGYHFDEMQGRNVSMLMPQPYQEQHDQYLANYRTTGIRKIIGIGREVEGRRKDGSVFPLDLAVNEMVVGNKRMFTGIVRDLSERKKGEKMQAEFVSTVSHELRTPLTSIRGSLGLVVAGVAGDISAKAHQLVDIAHKNCERLVNLINDILDIEKIASGRMNFELAVIDLMPVVRHAVEANQAYAAQHQCAIVIGEFPQQAQVMVDSDRLMQVLANLLSNAAKYSPPDGEVTLAVTRVDGSIRVSVHDQGPGIPPEFHSRIFQRFAQADSSDTRQKGGTGLGLSITKAIVEKMGGKIDFVTGPEEGTTFYLDLPELVEREPVTGDDAPRQRVLVVEDDPDIATLLCMMLETVGLDVEVCYSAEQAKERLARNTYDVMTLDIMLPGQDGISLIRELRSNEATLDLPIIVVSAKTDESREALDGSALEIIDWQKKPIDQKRLLAAIDNAARRAKRERREKPRILHIEDDPDVRQIVSDLLEKMAQVVGVSNLKQARTAIENRHYDLVILDIGLPDGSGVEIMSELKAISPSIPILVFSAFDFDKKAANMVSAALVKSRTSNQELVQMIKSLLKQRGSTVPQETRQQARAGKRSP